jgi:hypothetical protein
MSFPFKVNKIQVNSDENSCEWWKELFYFFDLLQSKEMEAVRDGFIQELESRLKELEKRAWSGGL